MKSEVGDLLDLASFKPRKLSEPDAWAGHIPFAYWLMQNRKPDLFVELGTHTGNSYFAFCEGIAMNGSTSKAFAVDTWRGDEHAGFYDDSVHQEVSLWNEQYANFSTLIRSTFDDALELFEEQSIDILHIDGLHTYEAVKHDFESWLPKMRPGALVLFHDTNVRRGDFGVYRLWREISTKYPSFEFSHSNGLGIIQLSSEAESLSFIETFTPGKFSAIFASLGAKLTLTLERDRLAQERDRLAQERDRLAQERDRLAQERDRLAEIITAIKDSLSWKVTSPMRRIFRPFRKS